jgi:hypothetical protein
MGADRPYILENSGGPVATRTPDLYRVKVVPVNHLQTSALKTQGLRDRDLDLKWTSSRVWTLHGPHTLVRGMAQRLLLRARSFCLFNVVVARQQSILLSGWFPWVPWSEPVRKRRCVEAGTPPIPSWSGPKLGQPVD